MSGIEREAIATIAAPYRREVRLEKALYESGMEMLRVIIREGHRITQIDIDADTARQWAGLMTAWADAQPAGAAETGGEG